MHSDTPELAEATIFKLVFGHLISGLRKQQALVQEELAREIGVSQPTLSRIERGLALPDVLLNDKLATALSTTTRGLDDYLRMTLERTRQATAGATGEAADSELLWLNALKLAGTKGMSHLAAFTVAAVLHVEGS